MGTDNEEVYKSLDEGAKLFVLTLSMLPGQSQPMSQVQKLSEVLKLEIGRMEKIIEYLREKGSVQIISEHNIEKVEMHSGLRLVTEHEINSTVRYVYCRKIADCVLGA